MALTGRELEEHLKRMPPFKKRKPQPQPRPAKLICVNGVIIADAVVTVSRSDPNWFRSDGYRAYLTGDVVTVRTAVTSKRLVTSPACGAGLVRRL